MRAMILAAGRGERLRPLTDETPKPLLPVGKHRLIEYHLYKLAAAGISDVAINLNYKPDMFRQALGNGDRYGLRIEYLQEEFEGGLETGGGIYNALSVLGDAPFIALNADVWTDYPFQQLPTQLSKRAHLVLVDNPTHNPDGDFYLENGAISAESGTRLTFAGIGVYHPQLFADCRPGRFPLAPILRDAATHHQVTAEHFNGQWQDIGSLERYQNICRRGGRPQLIN